MSTELAIIEHVIVTRYAGPVRTDNLPRQRFQIGNELTGEYVTLNYEQFFALRQFLIVNAASEFVQGEDLAPR